MSTGQLSGEGYQCPACGKRLDGYTSVSTPNATPRPGDLTLCAYCLALLSFSASGFRQLTEQEIDGLPADVRADLARARKAIERFNKGRPS